MDAWLTSAVEDVAVNKAIVLAGSLRRVHTAKKLVVLTTLAVSEDLRAKLRMVYDLVVLLEQDSPVVWNLEDYAKVEGLALTVFNKCVYLSPNTLVLRNCDEMFEKYEGLAAFGDDGDLDSSVFLFTPTLSYSQALRNMAKSENYKVSGNVTTNEKRCGFTKCFNLWLRNIPNWEKLDGQYNVLLNLDSEIPKSLGSAMAIITFGDAHPLDFLTEVDFENWPELGTIEKFVGQLCWKILSADVNLNQDCLPTHQPEIYKTEPIAIVGMAFRLPGANNVEEFWELLNNGKDGITVPPKTRWTREHTHVAYEDIDRKIQGGFLTVPVDEFDAKFFGISGKEAELLDPQQRFLHEVTWEALEDAMIDPLSLRGTQTGVFVGSWTDDYKDMVRGSVDADFFRVYMGNSIATGAARLSHFLEVTGPSIATESGCSSAVVAVDMACKSLRSRDCNLALACGVNLILKPIDMGSFSFFISRDGRCKTFDEGANGFGRAEGCAVLIMKRLSDAVRDGDNIWGLIRGSAVTQEGLSKSLGTPTVHSESLAMELALKDAYVDPLAVSYIEAHGAGTQVGDPIEIAAVAKVYSKGRSEPLVIGSVKTNVGHTESVSGITGIIKVLLAMKNETIPKHLNFKQLNPAINLDVIPAKIPLEPVPWSKLPDKPRIAGVSSFGITGTDGHVILQEPPVMSNPQIQEDDERPLHIFKVSAKSQESFQELLETYENMFSSKENDEGFADLAYSANTGRATFNHRAVIIAKDFKDAGNILKNKSFKLADVPSAGSKLCFLFTGQGSQYSNMAATLYNTSPIFRDSFNKCDQLLTKRHGINLRKVLWGNSKNGSELCRTLFSQTSIFCVEYCLLKLWESWGVKPDYVMGHSLGEFAAAVAAGALGFEDALMLVAERSRLIDNLPMGKMLVIQADKNTVDKRIEEFKQVSQNFWVDYAALNSSAQTVVAGDATFIEEFAKYCGSKSLKTTILAATHAFHSRLMEPMLESYRKVAQTVNPSKIEKSAPKYISGMEGKLVSLEHIDAEYWVRHTIEPVSFIGACKVAQREGCSLFLELGPHPVLSALTMMNMEGQSLTCLPSIRRKEEEWATMLDSLAKLYLSEWKGQINWKGFDRYYKRSRVSIPFYPFNRKPVWKSLEAELPTVHPLLGKVIPTDCGHSIFESRLTLKNTSFVQDHSIGNTAIFPGAAFLEMCLAGGYLTGQDLAASGTLKQPSKPIVLQSLKIVSLLPFYDSKMCRLQTISELNIEENDEIIYTVRVSRHVPSEFGGAGEWMSHSSATFLPVQTAHTKEQYKTLEIDIPSIQNSWQKISTAEFYGKLPQVGLHFGPRFKSLEIGWKSDQGMLFGIKMRDKDDQNYLINPVVADAMIQATLLWTTKDNPKLKLQVPVQIEEFTWLQASTSATGYVYCTTNVEGNAVCLLLDDNGNCLAIMSGVDFLETSLTMVEGKIHQQANAMPNMWKEVWKCAPGALQSAYDLRISDGLQLLQLNDEQNQFLARTNDLEETEKCFYNNICSVNRHYFLNAMYELGWKPKQRVPFALEDLVKLLPNPPEHFKKYIRFFLDFFVSTKMLVAYVGKVDTYYFDGLPPTQTEIQQSLQELNCPENNCRVEYQLAVEVGRKLAQILLGKIKPLHMLFSDDPNKPNANQWYTTVLERLQPVFELLNNELIIPLFSKCHDVQLKNNIAGLNPPILRVLEVGAGTGSFTETFLRSMEVWRNPMEFYFTDISASFFDAAEEKFKTSSRHMIFKKFDIEVDALAQGFCPKYFDMILAYEVLHVTKDIRKTLRNLKCLLKPGGILQISETTQQDPMITQVFGLLEGYWQFQDLDIRPNHATMTVEKWEQVLREINCDKVICTPMCNYKHSLIIARLSPNEMDSAPPTRSIDKAQLVWLIFYHESNRAVMEFLQEKLVGVNRKVYTVKRPSTCSESGMKELMKSEFQLAGGANGLQSLEGVVYLWGLSDDITDRDQSRISLPLINVVQEMLKCLSIPRLYVVTQGTANVEGYQVTNPAAGTLHGIIKSFTNENSSIHLHCLDLCPDEAAICQVGNIFQDLWETDLSNRSISYRENIRLLSRLARAKVSNNEPLSLPNGCARFQLQLPNSKMISDLQFGVLENYVVEENEVEVEIKAVALNFADVFTILKPISQFENHKTVGMDFAGVITKVGPKVAQRKVGDRVIGMNMDGLSFPSHIRIEEHFLIPIPQSVTLTEGATLPLAFSTVFLCLVKLAKMKQGDKVLIHTASGGVGLCAIQLAQRVGAEIFATAGSKRKQNYLRNIGIQHVFHSRTTHFGRQILQVTNGNGVDIILNSLTGEGFKEASLSALAKNGKFIEMSKLNVWRPEEVKEIRHDVFYQIVDLLSREKAEILELFEALKEFLSTDHIRPIPYERFDAVNIKGALNYMQKAKHIGKIVCVMPEVKVENSKIVSTTPLCNEFSTYLITGGLGGIGFELVKWMLNNGAKHIAIASRRNPNPEVAAQIQFWNKRGKHVEVFQVDIGDYHQCQHLFQVLQSPDRGFPQLRGVMHVAGVLADAILENQSWGNFIHTYNAKVNGTWNLHDLTKEFLLEHFVVFSSMAAALGSPGQSNHAASNNFEDSLIAYRISNGLPATTVNWGNWGEVGVATQLDMSGFCPITTSQGMLALETFLKTQMSHLAVLNIQSFTQTVKSFPRFKSYVEDKSLFGDAKATVTITSDDFWKDVDNAEDLQMKLLPFKNLLKVTLKNVLKIDPDEVIDDSMNFQKLGIDSLMILELRNGLQNILGSRLSPTASQLKDCSNTEEMANKLLSILQGNAARNNIKFPTTEELNKLVREDSTLPEYVRPSEGMSLVNVSEIATVLLTGATGTLGPYILRELSHRPNIQKIYCLVRKTMQASPMERLLKRLHVILLADQVDLSKVECIQGDITEDKFGLSEEGYNRIAKNVDAIFNSAVRMSLADKYYVANDKERLDLRTVNVKGTIRILEFAVHTKLKHVYHASTMVAVRSTNDDGCFLEDWQDVGVFDQSPYNWGYPLSKHISEQLCRHAVERGIPCKVFRHPSIGGDSMTGRCDYGTNHMMLRWFTYFKLGYMPDTPFPMIVMSVDQCAQISLDLFFNPRASPGVYNITQRDTGMDRAILTIAKELGIHVEPISLSKFVKKMKLMDDSPLSAFDAIYRVDGVMGEMYAECENPTLDFYKKYSENRATFYRSRKLPQLIENYDQLESTESVVRRDLVFLKESGVFDKFGIKYLKKNTKLEQNAI